MIIAKKIIRADEGLRLKPYYDSKKYPSWGFGFRCADQYGRFLDANAPLPNEFHTLLECEEKLEALLVEYESSLRSNADLRAPYLRLNEVRKGVILSMAHHMGFYGMMLFRGMWRGIVTGDFEKAAVEIMDSQAGRDPELKARMQRNSDMMRTGVLLSYYR